LRSPARPPARPPAAPKPPSSLFALAFFARPRTFFLFFLPAVLLASCGFFLRWNSSMSDAFATSPTKRAPKR
jgi:hypothetical protein